MTLCQSCLQSHLYVCLFIYITTCYLSFIYLNTLIFISECHLGISNIMFQNQTLDIFPNNWYFLHYSFWQILPFLSFHIIHTRNAWFCLRHFPHLNNSHFFFNLKPYCTLFMQVLLSHYHVLFTLIINTNLITEISW